MFYRLGGVPLMVYQTSYAGTAQNTVFAIETDDLAGAMAALREKGVTFMDYDFPGLKTVDGVAELPARGPRGSPTARATSSRWASGPDADPVVIHRRRAGVRPELDQRAALRGERFGRDADGRPRRLR